MAQCANLVAKFAITLCVVVYAGATDVCKISVFNFSIVFQKNIYYIYSETQ